MGGKVTLDFGPDQIRTLVFMATDSSHKVIMGGKLCPRVFSTVFDRILFILAGNDDIHKSLDEFEIWPDSKTDYGISCKKHILIMGKTTSLHFIHYFSSDPFHMCR